MPSVIRRIGLSLIANKVSDLLISPKTTLPALLSLAGAPVFFVSLLVPIKEAGALLPQALFAKILSRYPHRHTAWRIGMLMQLLCSVLLLSAGFNLHGVMAGMTIILLLAFWSISRSLCSLTYKDIQGVHITKGERGKLIGSAATISSLIAMAVAMGALYIDSSGSQIGVDKLLPIGSLAVLAQGLCLFIMWPIKTVVAEVHNREFNKVDIDSRETERNERVSKTFTIFTDSEKAIFKRFVVMRSLLAHSALIAPVFTLAYSGGAISILAFLIISQAAAGIVSSYIWGAIADNSAVICMRLGAIIAAAACLSLLVIKTLFDAQLANMWLIVGLFFILCVGHNGVRTGRKIYSVDIFYGQKRTAFVALTNSVVGALILLAGFFYSFLSYYSLNMTLIFMLIGLTVGGLLTFRIKPEK